MLFFNKKKKKDEPEVTPAEQTVSPVVTEEPVPQTEEAPEEDLVEIEVEEFPSDEPLDERRLFEIKEPEALKNLFEIAYKGAQATSPLREKTYKVVLPKGAKLQHARQNHGEKVRGVAYRGSYTQKGKGGIAGHVELRPTVGRQLVTSATNVAKLALEEYYLERIGSDFKVLKEGIARISDFQESEYRGAIEALFYGVQKIIDYKDELLGNAELRTKTLLKLADYEDECSKLLGQASNALDGIVKKIPSDYAEYEGAMREAGKWRSYQSTVLQILRSASELQFALSFGKTSNGLCYATFNRCLDRAAATQGMLPEWHRNATERLEIDLEANRRKRYGTDQMLHMVQGWFKKDQNYCALDENVAQIIKEQSGEPCLLAAPEEKNLFEQDVPLIFRNGKVYYYAQDAAAVAEA